MTQCAALIGGPRVSDFYARQLPVAGEAIDNTEWRGDLGYTLKNTGAGTPDILDAVVTAVVKSAPALYVSVGDAATGCVPKRILPRPHVSFRMTTRQQWRKVRRPAKPRWITGREWKTRSRGNNGMA